MSSEISVDTVSEYTSGSGVTVDGVLIKDSKVAPSAGGGLVLINKTTVSAQNYATVDNVFSSDYSHYKVKANLVASDTDIINLRFRTGGASGADHTGSAIYSYNYSYLTLGASGGETHTGATPDNHWRIASGFDGNTGFGVELYTPFEAKNTLGNWHVVGSQSGTDYYYEGAGFVNDTTSLTGFGFYLSTSSRTLTGEILTYGYSEG